MPINEPHKEYRKNKDVWEKIENITSNKDVGQHLITLNPLDLSPENVKRNEQYKARAIFYPIAGHTVTGLLGSIFRKAPKCEVSAELEYLKKNGSGSGLSIYQLSQAVCADVLTNGRAGVAVSFPETTGEVTVAQIQNGDVSATIHHFSPVQILNWQTIRVGSKVLLSRVVLSECQMVAGADEYSPKEEDVLREMFLDDAGVYSECVWRKIKEEWTPGEIKTPTDAKNQPWREIPFSFVGSENNDPCCDNPPMLGIVDLNIGHFRNSADYEDSVWFCGQAQPWMSGITQAHIDLLKTNGMYVGSRNLIGVPTGEQFGFAQATANPMVRQAMVDKLDGMVAMGARLMQRGTVVKTASQDNNEQEAGTSRLSMVASNVSEAFTQALKWAARYVGAKEEGLDYQLSQDFVNMSASPQEIQQIVAGFMQGAIPPADYVRWMKKQDLFDDTRTEEEYLDMLPAIGV